jgi:hypothetical protein
VLSVGIYWLIRIMGRAGDDGQTVLEAYCSSPSTCGDRYSLDFGMAPITSERIGLLSQRLARPTGCPVHYHLRRIDSLDAQQLHRIDLQRQSAVKLYSKPMMS